MKLHYLVLMSLSLSIAGYSKTKSSKTQKATSEMMKPSSSKEMKKHEAPQPQAEESAPSESPSSNSGVSKPVSIGITPGAAIANESLGVRFAYGARFAYGIMNNASAGFFVLNSSKRISGLDVGILQYGLDFNYHVMSYQDGPYLGALLGMSSASVSLLGIRVSISDFMVGPTAGWDFKVADNISVGPSVNYTFVTGDSNYSVFNALMALKIYL